MSITVYEKHSFDRLKTDEATSVLIYYDQKERYYYS
jgi:hypothetical protein